MSNVVTFPEMAQEFQIGLLSFGREAGMKASDLGAPHPDNLVGWHILATETLVTVANLVGKKLPARTLAKAVPVFRTNYVNDDAVATLFNDLGEAIIAHISAIAPEDYFPDLKASQVKRAMASACSNLQKIFDLNGHIVVFHLLYAAATTAEEEGEEFTQFVSSTLYDDMPLTHNTVEILKHVKAINKLYKSWDKANVKTAERMEYVELDVEERLA